MGASSPASVRASAFTYRVNVNATEAWPASRLTAAGDTPEANAVEQHGCPNPSGILRSPGS